MFQGHGKDVQNLFGKESRGLGQFGQVLGFAFAALALNDSFNPIQ